MQFNKRFLEVGIFCLFASTYLGNSQLTNGTDIEITVIEGPYSLEFYLTDTVNYELQNVNCKGVRGNENFENEPHICSELDPCTKYEGVVLIKRLKDNVILEKTVKAETLFKDPLVAITKIEPNVTSINIEWEAADITCIANFSVEVKSAEKDYISSVLTVKAKNAQSVTGLNPCRDHHIILKTFALNNTLISTGKGETTTLYAEPGNVDVNLTDDVNGQVKVTWDLPKYKSCVDYYLLVWGLPNCIEENTKQRNATAIDNLEQTEVTPPIESSCLSKANLTDQNQHEYIINNLQGCEDYVFVLYINKIEAPKSETIDFQSPQQGPSKVANPKTTYSSNDIQIQWDPPTSHSKCVLYYKVLLTGPAQEPDESKSEKVTGLETRFYGLHPCGQYSLSVQPISHNGTEGGISNLKAETEEAAPSEVQNATVTSNDYSMNISWIPPKYGNLCLKGYRIVIKKEEPVSEIIYQDTKIETQLIIERLLPCQSYMINIVPTTRNETNGQLTVLETETSAARTTGPTKFQAVGVYPNALELSAQDINSTCEIIFAKFLCVLLKPGTTDVPHKSAEQYVEGLIGGISFRALLSPLSPYTEYKCSVKTFNVAGWSGITEFIKRTEPYFPDPPEKVQIKASTNVSLTLGFTAPKSANGIISLYILHFQPVDPAYYRPPRCAAISKESNKIESSNNEQNFVNLSPFTMYSIQIAARNDYGVGEYTRPYMVATQPWISDPVTNFDYQLEGPYESSEHYEAKILINWVAPCRSNGEIQNFILTFFGQRKDWEDVSFVRVVPPAFDASGRMDFVESELKPEYYYTIEVAIQNKNVYSLSRPERRFFESPAGIPRTFNETAMNRARVSAAFAKNPTNSAVVRFPIELLQTDVGSIVYMALLISEKHCNTKPDLHFGAIKSEHEWPNVRSWHEAYGNSSTDCIYQYQTTPRQWNPTQFSQASNGRSIYEYIEYFIGIEKCNDQVDDIDLITGRKNYCNGPLKPETDYYLVIRLFTKNGFSDAMVLDFRTDALIRLKIIIIGICTCLLLALIAGLAYIWVTRRMNMHRTSCNGVEDAFGDTPAKNFAVYYREISRPEKIQREFRELSGVAIDLSFNNTEMGSKSRNPPIRPYDKNRVILDIDAEGSDYINASFIDGFRTKKEYIAASYPRPEYIMDFWRMILQYNVRVIVMLAQYRAGNVVKKTYNYFPFKSNGINVIIKKKDSFDLYERSEISLTHEKYGMKQKVVHYYFRKWPEDACPSDPMQVISFMRKVKTEKIPNYSPIVVHCTDGVGPTGTVIGLDIIRQRLKYESKINIYETVKKLRFQRMQMVQTQAQYAFLYMCTYELVKHKNSRASQNCAEVAQTVTPSLKTKQLSIDPPKGVRFAEVIYDSKFDKPHNSTVNNESDL